MPRIKWIYKIKGPDGDIQEVPSATIAARRIQRLYPPISKGIDDPGPYGELYGTEIYKFFKGDQKIIDKFPGLKSILSRYEPKFTTCDHCGKKIYVGERCVTVDGYTTKFCSPGCAAYYFLDVYEGTLGNEEE